MPAIASTLVHILLLELLKEHRGVPTNATSDRCDSPKKKTVLKLFVPTEIRSIASAKNTSTEDQVSNLAKSQDLLRAIVASVCNSACNKEHRIKAIESAFRSMMLVANQDLILILMPADFYSYTNK